MATDKRKKAIIAASSIVLLGIGGYFLYSFLKKRKEEKEQDQYTPVSTSGGYTPPAPSAPSTPSYTPKPSGIDTLAFQKYANSKGYSPKLVEDGIWGRNTAAAWDKLGSDFGTAAAQATQGTTPQWLAFQEIKSQMKQASEFEDVTNVLGTVISMKPPVLFGYKTGVSGGRNYVQGGVPQGSIAVGIRFWSDGKMEALEGESGRALGSGTYTKLGANFKGSSIIFVNWGGFRAALIEIAGKAVS